MLPDDLLEIISHMQLLMPGLIWDKTAYKSNHGVIQFVTIKKRLNFYELTQVCNFVGGVGLSKSKFPYNFRYRFVINKIPLLVVIDTFSDIRNIKTLNLNNNINIKFIE